MNQYRRIVWVVIAQWAILPLAAWAFFQQHGTLATALTVVIFCLFFTLNRLCRGPQAVQP